MTFGKSKKPCPLCGRAMTVIVVKTQEYNDFFYECENVGCYQYEPEDMEENTNEKAS
jgi:hypothetical protein